MNTQTRAWKPALMVGLAAIAFVIVAAGAAVAKKLGMLEATDVKRVGLISIGLVLVVAGNAVPKLRLFAHEGFPPARALIAQRLSGWTLVMAGLAVAGFWIGSATTETLLASGLVGVGAFAVMGAAWTWLLTGPRQPVATDDSDTTAPLARNALVYILLGLFWAFATFLADALWGDKVSTWMAIVFSVGIAIVPVARIKSRRQHDTGPCRR